MTALMNHRWLVILGFVLPTWMIPVQANETGPNRQPNLLWITVEDLSPDLGCYGSSYAITPNLDRFARESVRYTNAFATAPVCSPSRSCLITGVYATTLGTQRLRSDFPIPDRIRGFPASLREAGYFTTNRVKTDYNTSHEPRLIRESWDRNGVDAGWRMRPDSDQPFFSVINLMTTHQSRTSVWPQTQFEREVGQRLPEELRHDPAEALLPAYYPDTSLVRQALARYHDCITLMDREVGDLLRQLEEDGLSDSTIVIFFSDHGMGMPRGKRVLQDSGLRVPLMIRFPKRFRHLAPGQPGSTCDQLVSFVDFPPTMFALAGLEAPEHFQGVAFLAADDPPRKFVFGARDRVDEAYDVSRSVRDQRYLYIRNFMPHRSWMQPERYSDASQMRQELFKLRAKDHLTSGPMTYAAKRRSQVEFYDTWTDPDQVRNLAANPAHQELRRQFERQLRAWMNRTRDLGTLPESWIRKQIGQSTPYEWSLNSSNWQHAQAAAWDPRTALERIDQDVDPSTESVIHYWACLGLRAKTEFSPSEQEFLEQSLQDRSVAVRLEAAGALATFGLFDRSLPVLVESFQDSEPSVVLQAIREIELIGEPARAFTKAVADLLVRARHQEADPLVSDPCWMFVRFSCEAFLEKIAKEG